MSKYINYSNSCYQFSQEIQASKMSVINSIYIPHVKSNINAEYIANVFYNSGIASLSRVAIESGKNGYSRVYLDIDYWQDTETAFNYIKRLRNKEKETRLVYEDDNWWLLEINKYPHKTQKANKKRELTIFVDKDKLVSEEDDNYEKDIKDFQDMEEYLMEYHENFDKEQDYFKMMTKEDVDSWMDENDYQSYWGEISMLTCC